MKKEDNGFYREQFPNTLIGNSLTLHKIVLAYAF
jgi:hypothetical protein